MIERPEITAIVKGVISVVRDHLAAAAVVLNGRLDQLEERLKAIPAGNDGAPGRDGVDGQSPDPLIVRSVIVEEVSKVASGWPIPKDGIDGKDGESIIGPAGPVGAPGESIKGDTGDRGVDGAPGKDGSPGESIIGPVGPAGATGDTGGPGPSAFDIARTSGYVGSEAEWLASLRGKDAAAVDTKQIIADVLSLIPPPKDGKDGERGTDGLSVNPEHVREWVTVEVSKAVAALPPAKDGPPGIDGKDGSVGPQGERGADGLSIKGDTGDRGTDGSNGQNGEKGIDGKDGRDGREGKDGRDGMPGRDALEIEILGAIDEAKSYPRGTFAKFNKGLVRAIRNTEPGAPLDHGWEVIVEGFAGMKISQAENFRTFYFQQYQTSGALPLETFSMPVVLQRDVYAEGTEYARGDCVTYDGSQWICCVDSTKGKPGISPDWKLSVRRGREGRPGKDGKEGPQGKSGRDGHDFTQVDFNGAKH